MNPGARPARALLVALLTLGAPAGAQTPDAVDEIDADAYDDEVDEELVVRVRAEREARPRMRLSADEARRIPGAQGDPLKAVQGLPGVVQTASGSGALAIWGAAPEDSRVLVDGVEVPALYHLGGVRSTVNPALVGSLSLVPGAFGPQYGRAVGGVIEVGTRALTPDTVEGEVAVDLFDAAAFASAPVGPDARVAVAGRWGYLDRLATRFVDDDAAALYPLPAYRDAQLKAEVDIGHDAEAGVLVLWSDDAAERSNGAVTDRQTADHIVVMTPVRAYADDGGTVDLVPYFTRSHRGQQAQFGATPAGLAIDTTTAGVRATWRAPSTPLLDVTLGLDGQARADRVTRTGSLTRPAREGDITVFGQPPGDDVNAETSDILQADVGVHGQLQYRLGPLSVSPGLRLDVFALEGDRVAPPVGRAPRVGFTRVLPALSPRLSVRWAVTPDVDLRAAAGRYHQAPRAEELSAVFGNPDLELVTADHLTVGLGYELAEGLRVDLTGYVEMFEQVVSRSPASTPPLAGALTGDGTGHSMGLQVLLRRQVAGGLSGWLAYTLADAERVDVPGGTPRPFDYDRTHALTAVLEQPLGPIDLGARFRYATGMPRTPVVGAFYDVRGDAFQPIFGAHNSIRLPDHLQLDLRIGYTATLEWGEVATWLEVQNVTAQENTEEIAYTADFSARRDMPGLPPLAVLGARVTF